MNKTIFIFICLVNLLVTPAQVNFSKAFIEINNSKYSFEVHELHELIHIIFSITEYGGKSNELIYKKGSYYQRVKKQFWQFKNDPLVRKMNKELNGRLFIKGMYSRLKMDACGYYFNNSSKLIKDSTYSQLNWDSKNYIDSYISQLEEFSKKTKFRDFFKSNKLYYDSLLVSCESQMPIREQWNWLEEKFEAKFNNYRIILSPLVNGSHCTNNYLSNNFNQCIMFICGPYEETNLTQIQKEFLMSKIIFTEMDHNYINPISRKYQKALMPLFKSYIWRNGKDSKHYKNGLLCFNEYMTWSVFCLYLRDNYETKEYEILRKKIEDKMTDVRGFCKFKEFNTKLLDLYSKQSKISELYPEIIAWSRNEVN